MGQQSEAQVGVRIAVVDDDADVRESLSQILGYWGYTAQALQGYAEFSRRRVEFDVALVGVGCDGDEVAQALRQAEGPGPKLVAMTCWPTSPPRRGSPTGFDCYIQKPFSVAELRTALRLVALPLASA